MSAVKRHEPKGSGVQYDERTQRLVDAAQRATSAAAAKAEGFRKRNDPAPSKQNGDKR